MRNELRIRVVLRQQRRRVPQRDQAGRRKDGHLGFRKMHKMMVRVAIEAEAGWNVVST